MDNIYALDSRRRYPPIVRSGSIPFTKGSSGASFTLTQTQLDERYLVYIEESGWLRRPAFYDSIFNGSNLVYTEAGELKLYIGDSYSRSGTIHWRAYYDKV